MMNKILNSQYNFSRLTSSKWFVFFFITCLALGLRLHHLDYESLFMDELLQVSYYKGTFSEVIKGAFQQQQPPLDYLVGALFNKASESDYMIRLPAALWGTGSVLLIMFLSSTFASWPIAAFVGLIMALSPYHIYFSQEARPYSIPVFFLLAMLTSLQYLLTSNRVGARSYIVFFILCLGFLLTRSLSPLATYVSLGIILFVMLAKDITKKGFLEKTSFRPHQNHLITLILILLVSLLLYSPFLIEILQAGQRFLNEKQTHDIAFFISRLSEFSFSDIIQAWFVQFEPFATLFLVLYGLSLIFIINEKNDEDKYVLVRLLTALLPLSFFIHYTVFRIHTSLAFRPPYPIYLLPLVLLLTSYSLEKIRLLLSYYRQKNITKLITIVASILIMYISVITLTDFKSIRKKSNWRDVGKYLSEQYSTESVIVFSTLEPSKHWHPTFYGFDRYYYGQSEKTAMSENLAKVKHILEKSTIRPILMIFHYRDYFLTSHSRYPFITGIRRSPFEWQLSKWPEALDLKTFTGFSLITFNDKNPDISRINTVDQIHYMIDSILPVAPQDSALVEWHLTASFLTPEKYKQHKLYHIEQAKKIARIDQQILFEKEENN
ncbi:MAG TPA: hypothetical protein EYQ84_06045 [Nitrospinaceae bacterium]|jgi:4-amino-4-deoxy-L-arabinose transferase-like glycosyltransferase|nr:hypothetical protein [Nitrospinaceae bacterium]